LANVSCFILHVTTSKIFAKMYQIRRQTFWCYAAKIANTEQVIFLQDWSWLKVTCTRNL